MKLKRNFFERILASLMLLAISLPCAINGQAQNTYRGFVEGGLGCNYHIDGGNTNISYMLATTHGFQLKNNFFGIGIGIIPGYCIAYKSEMDSGYASSQVSLPIYCSWRYDFFNSDKTLKPYVGVKVGPYLTEGSLLYAALDFGFRKRISETSGISFGIAVQTSNESYSSGGGYYKDWDLGLNFLAKVAFDF